MSKNYLVTLLLTLTTSLTSVCQVDVNSLQEIAVIGKHIQFYDATSHTIPIDSIAALPEENWIQGTAENNHYGLREFPLWTRIIVQHDAPTTAKWQLLFDNVETDSITFFYKQNNAWQWMHDGLLTSATSKSIDARNFYFPLYFNAQQNADTFYLRTKVEVTYMLPISIGTEAWFAKYQYNIEKYYGIYFGFLICMLLFNLLIYTQMRDFSYLLYSFTILSTALLFAAISGHLKYYLLPFQPTLAAYSVISLSGMVMFTVSIFMIKALQVKKLLPFAHKLYVLFATWGLLEFILNPILGRSHFIEIANLGIGSLAITILITSILVYRKGNNYAIYFFFAWFAYAAGGILIVLRNLQVIPFNNLSTHAPEIGSALEVVLIAFALGEKYKRAKKESEMLQQQIIEMQQNATLALEEEVTNRTQELAKTNESLLLLNQNVEAQNKKITDSITYASTIQKSILSVKTEIESFLPSSFIIFRPRDIVSGDFYWFKQDEKSAALAVVDCTGHGVPGAIMSMLGFGALNHISEQIPLLEPHQTLEQLDAIVNQSLNQSQTENRDGMDINLVAFDKSKKVLHYSGANNSLYITHPERPITEIKSVKRAIGGLKIEERAFEKHTIALEKGCTYFLFSDGFQDQFGGPKGKKLMVKRFREILQSIAHLSITEQYKALENELNSWMQGFEQTDDILVIGFQV